MKYIFPIVLFLLSLPKISTAQVDTSSLPERPCPFAFTVEKSNKTYTLRYSSNHSMAERNENIKQLVIFIHGIRRNAVEYFDWGMDAVKKADKDAQTLFIAPQFSAEKDLNAHKQDANHLFWSNGNWRSGDESVSSKKRAMPETFSSYSLVDSMIARVCNPVLFPNLKKITIIGHSAGGQFVQRYIGMTPMPNILRGYKFRFIAMNPSSYMYFDDRRPVVKDTLLFFRRPDSALCSTFNDYPKGFEKLNPYAAKIGMNSIFTQFFQRDVVFLFGGNDVDMTDPNLDKTCSGSLQGLFRLERGQFFYEYLQTFVEKGKVHKMEIVPNVGHNAEKMVNSKAAIWYLFN
jgi:hypothetical protein